MSKFRVKGKGTTESTTEGKKGTEEGKNALHRAAIGDARRKER